MDDSFTDYNHLLDYLDGTASPEAQREVNEWLAANPARQQLLDSLRAGRRRVDTAGSPEMLEQVAGLRRQLEGWALQHPVADANPREMEFGEEASPRIQRRRNRAVPVLGVLGAAALAGILLFSQQSAPNNVDSAHIYQTAAGQRAVVQLTDGSSLTLAPATTAEVSSDGVSIEGEVYFHIVPNADRPFVVTTRNASVRVLGTRFVVRQYLAEASSQVMVEDGKVSLVSRTRTASPPSDQAVLTANMLGQVTDSSIAVTSGVSADNYVGWVHGRLVFSNVPLHKVVEELARAYGVSIEVADTSLAKRNLTLKASVDRQQVAEVLDLIGRATNAHYTRADSSFVLKPGRKMMQTPEVQFFPQPERAYGK